MPVASDFRWIGEGIPTSRRRNNELHYQTFINGDLKISIGDYVLVRNDDILDPEDYTQCYVAQVVDMYDTGEGIEPFRAKVQWYSRFSDLPAQSSKLLKNTWPCEIFEEQRNLFENMIDAESIFGKCVVIFIPKDSSPESVVSTKEKTMPVFYCRFKFSGIRFMPKLSAFKDSRNTSNQKPILLYGTPGNRKPMRLSSRSKVGSPQKQSEFAQNVTLKNGKNSDTSQSDNVDDSKKPIVLLHKIEKELNGFHIADENNILSQRSNRLSKSRKQLCNSPDISKGLKKNDSIVSPGLDISKLSLSTHAKYGKDESKCEINEFEKENGDAEMLCDFESPAKKAKMTPKRKCKTEPRNNKNENIPDSPAVKKPPPRRSLKFDADSFGATEKNEGTVTRYGRKVKPTSNALYSEIEDLLATPKKAKVVSKKSASERTRTKFYNSDVSDSDESIYKPSDASDSESDGQVVTVAVTPKAKQLKNSNNRITTPKSNKKCTSNAKTVRTPCYKKRISSATTPTIPRRQTPAKTPQSLLEESRQRLHVSAVPGSLPCRDEEYADIYAFVESNLLDKTGGCMYVSGVPGTGKTATVHEVIRNLEKERDNDRLPEFQFIEINGMKMTDPYQCYVQIFKKLTGERIAPQQAAQLLEKRFTKPGPKKEAVVLLVDELDKLWTRKQTVMYNIFDWPTKPSSKLIVVAIANTLDLPERLMMSRISSRLGLTRRTFQPYTFKELQEIVMSRIQELQVFDSDAVQLVARKVAAVSGDARRALEICKRAAEVAEEGTVKSSPTKKKKVLVGMGHVDAALQQMLASPEVTAIRSCSQLQKMFFHAILAEFQRTGCEEAVMYRVYRQLVGLCRFEGYRPPTASEVSVMCCHLASSYLILIDNVQNDLYMKIRLNISIDDVNYALSKSLN